MTAIQPFARLVDLQTGQVVAATSNIINYGWESCLDAVPKGHITVPLADPGSAIAGQDSFATVALSAAGGPGLPTMPAPLCLEFSLSGQGGATDFQWTSFQVERKVASGELVLELSGECSFAAYSTLPAGGGKTTMTDVALVDALSGAQGTIKPIDPTEQNRLVSADGTIPYLSGLLWANVALVQAHVSDATARLTGEGSNTVLVWEDPPGTKHAAHVGTIPGAAGWDIQARLNLIYTAVCASAVSGLPCWIDSLADTTTRAAAKIAQRAGGAVIPGDTVPQGARGHLVIDSSDQALNLSQVVE